MFLDGENEIIHENFISKLQIVHKYYMAHCSREQRRMVVKSPAPTPASRVTLDRGRR